MLGFSLFKDTWILEIGGLVLSLVSYALITVLLSQYNHQPVFAWHGVSLNTWVSLLSTIGKSLLLFTISACLSQWKFVWFSGGQRRLLDFDVFDGASRGPAGALSLLWDINFRSLASIGAVITVVALTIDPSVQLVITVEERQLLKSDNLTSIPRAVRYSQGRVWMTPRPGGGTLDMFIKAAADYSMETAISSGLSESPASISQQVAARCSSGHCEWQPYMSLSVCSTCTNITSRMTSTERKYNAADQYPDQEQIFLASDPARVYGTGDQFGRTGKVKTSGFDNGLHLDESAGEVRLVTYGTNNRSNTVTFKNETLLLWSMTMIKSRGGTFDERGVQPLVLDASECGLTYCVRNFTSAFINGTLVESSHPMPYDIKPGSWQYMGGDGEPETGVLSSNANQYRSDLQLGDGYNISQVAVNSIGAALAKVFLGSENRNFTTATNASGFFVVINDGQSFHYPDSMRALDVTTDMNATFNGLAMSMSNSLRANDDNSTLSFGTTAVVVYKVRWEWLALPFISVLGGCVFLAAVIFQTRAQGISVWKSSSLAVLKVGKETGGLLLSESSVKGMERRADEQRIRLLGARDNSTSARESSPSLGMEMKNAPEPYISEVRV